MRQLALVLTLLLMVCAAGVTAEEAKQDKIDVKAELNPWSSELEDPETVFVYPGAERIAKSERSDRLYSKSDSAHIWVSAGASWEAEAHVDTIVAFYRTALVEDSWEIVSIITFSGTARLEALRSDDRAIIIEVEPRGDVSNRISVTIGSPSLIVKRQGEAEEAGSSEEQPEEDDDVKRHEIIIW